MWEIMIAFAVGLAVGCLAFLSVSIGRKESSTLRAALAVLVIGCLSNQNARTTAWREGSVIVMRIDLSPVEPSGPGATCAKRAARSKGSRTKRKYTKRSPFWDRPKPVLSGTAVQ